jgi:adenylosuccinate lyase
MIDALNPAVTAASQWFERTLDDSANKRISVPEAFLATDAVLTLYLNVIGGLKLYPKIIGGRLSGELPFLATENILMYCVKRGGDRQTLHEAIRRHSIAALGRVKDGGENDLLTRIAADPIFRLTAAELTEIADPKKFIGMAEEQTMELCREARAVIARSGIPTGAAAEIKV